MNVSDSIQVPSGVLLIDKARDMTSHDVVAIARRSLGIKKGTTIKYTVDRKSTRLNSSHW